MSRRPRLELLPRPVQLFCYKKGKQRWDGGRNENRKRAGCECRSPVNAEVRQRRHGHCGWRCRGGGEGEKGGGEGGVAGTQSGFLSWHTLHCPFPACWKMPKSTAPPPSAKTLLSQARQGAAETKHFALSPFPARSPPGVFVWIHSDL